MVVLLPERVKERLLPEITPPKVPPPVEVRVTGVATEFKIVPPVLGSALLLLRAPTA